MSVLMTEISDVFFLYSVLFHFIRKKISILKLGNKVDLQLGSKKAIQIQLQTFDIAFWLARSKERGPIRFK